MARFNGKGKQVHIPVPDWLREEPDEKRKTAMLSYLFAWNMAGFSNKENLPLKEYFTMDGDDWTEEDTEYIIRRFIEEGYVIPKEE